MDTEALTESTITSIQRRIPLLRKSHSGCRDCRFRKVKCDEIKPVCSNCRRRYVSIERCDWSIGTKVSKKIEVQKKAEQHPTKPITNPPIRSLEFYPNTLTDSSRWRSLELRLMHHYSTIVSHVMPNCQGAPARAWQKTIPQLSFDSEIVLNPMLAISALHLHTHSPSDSTLTIALRRYLDRTLVNHRQALSEGEGLSEQLWLSGVLLCHVYWLLSRHPLPDEEYELPLQAIKMLEGVNVVFAKSKMFLSQLGYWSYSYESLPHVASTDELSISSQIQLRSIEEDLTHLMHAFSITTLADNLQSIYLEAKDSVLYHYRAYFSGISAQTLRRLVTVMPVRCQPEFRKLLEKHDPLAMALLARVIVSLRGLEGTWWINGGGEYEVVERDVRGILGLMPLNLRWTMEWPCRVLEGDIVLNRDF